MKKSNIIHESTATCPRCKHQERETMPSDACQWYYECEQCGSLLHPDECDCCVFCSYATVTCPPVQSDQMKFCCSD